MADNTFLAPLTPIQRSTASDRILSFERNEQQIYNKFSPYYLTPNTGRGPDEPYMWVKIQDGVKEKSFESQAFPYIAVSRDTERLIKFARSGKGITFGIKQAVLQSNAPFDETRTYNPGSFIGSARSRTFFSFSGGLNRHIESNRNILTFAFSSLLNSLGFESNNLVNQSRPIPGTASGPLPTYVSIKGNGRYGLIRGETAKAAKSKFDSIWESQRPGQFGFGFLGSVISALRSTTGLFNGNGRPADWRYRPEYLNNIQQSVYARMVEDKRGNLTFTGTRGALYQKGNVSVGRFYNDSRDPLNINDSRQQQNRLNIQQILWRAASDAAVRAGANAPDLPVITNEFNTEIKPTDIIRNYPEAFNRTDNRYASPQEMQNRKDNPDNQGLQAIYKRMLNTLASADQQHPMYNKSAERYLADINLEIDIDNNYKRIPEKGISTDWYSTRMDISEGQSKGLSMDFRGFSKYRPDRGTGTLDTFTTGVVDNYNTSDVLDASGDADNFDALAEYKDFIKFYFYDLVNQKYIPFRATIQALSDQHSPDWEDIKYMGRADKLFVYRGFTHDVNFNFRVYANSIQELVPMWKRINYLVGLVRPSKYTDRAIPTNQPERRPGPIQAIPTVDPTQAEASETNQILEIPETSGLESGFIYPPMIEFRIGDLYVDQPAIFKSINVSIPDESNWETLSEETYEYVYGFRSDGTPKTFNSTSKPRQLPLIADISVQLSLIEQERAKTGNHVFGPIAGWGV